MIIQCPACSTRYAVPDDAIGIEGRTVRCAKCRQSWFQDGPEVLLDDAAAAPPSAPEEAADPAPAAVEPPADPETPPVPAPASEAEPAQAPVVAAVYEDEPGFVEKPAVRTAMPPAAPAGYGAGESSQYDREPPFRRRRNPLRMWSWAAGIFALVAAGLIVAVSFYGLPEWVPVNRPTFAMSPPNLQIDFPPEQQERRELPNGTEFFGASGTITNIGTQEQAVPTLLIVLRDARDRIVYSWEVPPPKRQLAPGESLTVNEAVTDVPRSARVAEIGWKPE
ncbi:thioredoxin [Aurantiacibacter xanthus]|uniref:Thioredoxin n=1 Tax=Aurantiacibacter xanthus TaxID=1784712 RepID=A0A3A1P345_9SPHN|nr:MJ0042-type zinc finger domain-containing protein [Aurantiacibacter xanthus]RIV82928.1 thioredoxin [Aurantiacibacter xanthus]